MPDLSKRKGEGGSGPDHLNVTAACLRILILLAGAGCIVPLISTEALAASRASCRIETTTFEGWKGEAMFNDWVRLTIVPQLGGRLMQVAFQGHNYLFVNPQYKGKYFSPADSSKPGPWINYGGDKIWPLPEGRGPDYWPGPVSDALDDGNYKLTVVSQNNPCTVLLEGPADAATGLQYSREISIGKDSPQISFHAVMRNAAARSIRWSMQSVTQYDTADPRTLSGDNHDFWAFAPLNPRSAYSDGYRVRNGLADDPSYTVQGNIFTLHWMYLENEVWLDSDAGWIAVVDDSTKYGMIERFRYYADQEYPGKASVIFYKNGAALELDDQGKPSLRSNHPEETPYYMEAEINSPMELLSPGASYAMDTWWLPVRADRQIRAVTPAGVIERPLTAAVAANQLHLSGSFAVFFPGKLNAHLFDVHGAESGIVELESVDPMHVVDLNQTIGMSSGATRVTIHLNDEQGVDRGTLGEAEIKKPGQES